MNLIVAAALLAILQGLTEFLPVSSSGHLVLAKFLFGLKEGDSIVDSLLFDLVLHMGTLAAVVVYYRRDLVDIVRDGWAATRSLAAGRPGEALSRPGVRYLLLIGLATVPTGAIGVVFKKPLEAAFDNLGLVGVTLCITATMLLVSGLVERRRAARAGAGGAPGPLGRGIGTVMALVIGIVQGLAITPGISRSGSTISTALLFGIPREEAARFSFLLSIPAILGAVVLKARDALGDPLPDVAPMLVGFVVSALVGYAALFLLVRIILRGWWAAFAPYLFAVAGVALIASFLGAGAA